MPLLGANRAQHEPQATAEENRRDGDEVKKHQVQEKLVEDPASIPSERPSRYVPKVSNPQRLQKPKEKEKFK